MNVVLIDLFFQGIHWRVLLENIVQLFPRIQSLNTYVQFFYCFVISNSANFGEENYQRSLLQVRSVPIVTCFFRDCNPVFLNLGQKIGIARIQ